MRRAVVVALTATAAATAATATPPPLPTPPTERVSWLTQPGHRPHNAALALQDRPGHDNTPAATLTPTPTPAAPPAHAQPERASRSIARRPAPAVPAPRRPGRTPPAGGVAAVLGFALAQVGRPYIFGAAGPYGYDCSGLALAAYAHAGMSLPHNAAAMLGYGRPVTRAQLLPGDLVFPSSGHVQIYLGGGQVVEAANPREGVRVTAMWGFWTARRLW